MTLLKILIAVFIGAPIIGTALVLAIGERENRKAARSPAVWGSLLLITLVAISGVAWEELSLRHFARHEGTEVRGLIMKTVPMTTTSQFTKNGREYLYRAIQRPVAVTFATLIVVAFACTGLLYAHDLRRMIAAVWLHMIATFCAVAIFSMFRFFTAIDLFI